MGLLEDIMKALDRIPIWMRLQELPTEIETLKERVSSLESALARCPADGCPFCGARAFRLERVDMHGQREVWKCGDCQKQREVRHDLMNRPSRPGPATFGRGR